MADQLPLFSFNDMRPKADLKKIITRERMEEMRALLDKGDSRGVAERLSQLNDSLERYERRLTNRKK